ncbi:MAG: hypothetical protein ACD_23C00276G0002 [uncultured bacterium]|nr:MAG: hypothetical protein ACD_23C00276G0002 [uncultured bacterium]
MFQVIPQVGLNGFLGHTGGCCGCLAAVVNTVEMEVNADAIGKGFLGVIRGGQ